MDQKQKMDIKDQKLSDHCFNYYGFKGENGLYFSQNYHTSQAIICYLNAFYLCKSTTSLRGAIHTQHRISFEMIKELCTYQLQDNSDKQKIKKYSQ